MSLKIVSGSAKGRLLQGPKKPGIRPASALVRKSVFDILGDLSQTRVLDLYAGVGGMGIEALSRGAAAVTFVDKGAEAIQLIQKNLKTLNFDGICLRQDALVAIAYLKTRDAVFDLIFVDPPYDCGLIRKTLQALERHPLLAAQGLIVSEHSPREMPESDAFELVRNRRYGQTQVSFLKKK